MAVACDKPPREKKEKRQEKEDIYNNTIVLILYLDYYSRLEEFGVRKFRWYLKFLVGCKMIK